MAKDRKEWFRQADYDLEAATAMFNAGKFIYTVFMCHLSIEKALKGIYFQKLNEQPPKTHNLWYLAEKAGVAFPPAFAQFIDGLNRQSVVTRYPDDLRKMSKALTKSRAKELLDESEEVLKWLKERP